MTMIQDFTSKFEATTLHFTRSCEENHDHRRVHGMELFWTIHVSKVLSQ